MVVRDHSLVVKKSVGAIPDVSSFNDLAESGAFGDPRDIVQVVKTGGEFVISYKSKDAMLKVAGSYRKETPSGTFFVDPFERKRAYLKIYGLPFEVDCTVVAEALKDYGTVGNVSRDKFPGRLWYNGIRTVPILLKKDIEVPDCLIIDGVEAKVLNTSVQHCMLCKKNGHSKRTCPDLSCHNCGEWGHFSNRCPEARCSRCHNLGHWARQCKNGIEVSSTGKPKQKKGGPAHAAPAKASYADAARKVGDGTVGGKAPDDAAATGAVALPPRPPRQRSATPRLTRSWAETCDEDEEGVAGGVFKRRPEPNIPLANRFDALNEDMDLGSQYELLKNFEEEVVLNASDTGGAAT